MWEQHPAGMDAALEAHDEILETVVAASQGCLLRFRGEGDSTFSVFSRPSDAVAAAVAAQQALRDHDWPPGLRIEVRMGVHTGEALERDGDYRGSAPNRTARIRGLAGPAQILLSDACTTLLTDGMPDQWRLVDYGTHQLRGFKHADRIWLLTTAAESPQSDSQPGLPAWAQQPSGRRSGALRPMTGRQPELAILGQCIDAILQRRPELVLICGEAGIGKSTVASECCRLAALGGVHVVVSRCYQEINVPYLPWATVVQQLSGEDKAHPQMTRDLTPLLALMQAEPASRPELGLYLGLAQALLDAAGARPTLVVFEDLQWADQASLNLLTHALAAVSQAGAERPMPLMFVLTYRTPVTNDRLARRLAQYRVQPGCRELVLSGFDDLALNQFLASAAPQPPSPALLHSIKRASEGNPFLADNIVQRLWRTGQLVVAGGRLVKKDGADIALGPTDLQEELRARLDGVSRECHLLLAAAAVLGDDRPFPELRAVSDTPSGVFEALVEEAVEAGLLSDDGVSYRFEHPQVRAVCAASLTTSRRQQLHARIARSLIEQGEEASGEVLTIAHHLCQAGPAAPREQLASYASRAGDQAFMVAAWGEAAAYYQAALNAGACANDPEQLCRLQDRTCTAFFRDHDLTAAMDHGARAIALAERLGDLEVWGNAAVTLAKCAVAHGVPVAGRVPDLSHMTRFLDVAGSRVPQVRAMALAELADAHYAAFDFAGGLRVADEARALIRTGGGDLAGATVEVATGLQHMALLDLDEAAACFQRSVQHARKLSDPWTEAWGLGRLPIVAWTQGDIAGAQEKADLAARLAAATQDYAEHSLASACLAGIAASKGHFEEAEEHAARAHLMRLRSDYPFSAMLYCLALAHVRSCRGDREGAHGAIDLWREAGAKGLGRWLVLIDAVGGARDKAREHLAARPWGNAGLDSPDLFTVALTCAAVEIADVTDDHSLMAAAAPPLFEAARRGVVWTPGWPHFLPRLQGVAALMLGRVDEAAERLEHATIAAHRTGAAVEEARCRLDLAHAVEARGGPDDRARARQLSQSASSAFTRLGLLPFAASAAGPLGW
jgi:tetratricopeptide (TPR) repeat protein